MDPRCLLRAQGRDRGRVPTKGSPVYVSCRARTREYEKDGQKRYATEFVADKLILLGRGSGGGSGKEEAQAEAYADKPGGGFSDMADDIFLMGRNMDRFSDGANLLDSRSLQTTEQDGRDRRACTRHQQGQDR